MSAKDYYKTHRNLYTKLNEVYFFTITVNNCQHLLQLEENKTIVVDSLRWLLQKGLVKISGYVIMPNHIHLMWEQLQMNGKEFPKNSFENFTAKLLFRNMKENNDAALKNYEVAARDCQYNVWQRDPLAIKIFNR